MNWQDIKEKYPKGWGMIQKWYERVYSVSLKHHANNEVNPVLRDLYDFLDEQEIYVSMATVGDGCFTYTVSDKDGILVANHNGKKYTNLFVNRKEAEEAAFMKAFEILEGKL